MTALGLTSNMNTGHSRAQAERGPLSACPQEGVHTMRSTSARTWSRAGCTLATLAAIGSTGAGCGSSSNNGGSSSGGSKSINVAMVDNPQMKDIAKLTPSLFTAKTGIKVNYTILDETTLRQVTTRDVAAGGKQFDVAQIGAFEAPQFGQNGSPVDPTSPATGDAAYKLDDATPP